MVFCGVALERLVLLAEAGTLEQLDGRGATRGLLSAHQVDPAEDEEADYLAQSLASLDSLLQTTGPRVVVAVDAEASAVTVVEDSIGHIRLAPFDWSWVTAVFVDEPDSAPAIESARTALAGVAQTGLGFRVGEPGLPEPVTELLEQHPLLWFLPTELEGIADLHS